MKKAADVNICPFLLHIQNRSLPDSKKCNIWPLWQNNIPSGVIAALNKKNNAKWKCLHKKNIDFTFGRVYQGWKDFTVNFCPASKFLFYGIGNNLRMVAEVPIHVSTLILMIFSNIYTAPKIYKSINILEGVGLHLVSLCRGNLESLHAVVFFP